MARLLLLRHAKSSWDDARLGDYDRPLNVRGRASAPLMGRHIADHALAPDRVICSGARRTRETLAGILPHLSGDMEVSILRSLYEVGEEGYLGLIRRHGGKARTLLLVGHNPAIQETAISLIGSGNPEIIDEIGVKFPTAALAVIDVALADWRNLEPGSGRVVAFFRPRELDLVDRSSPEEADD